MKEPFSYKTIRQGEDSVLQIDCEQYIRLPSIEDDPMTMSRAIDILTKERNVTKIVFQQKRDYEYDFEQTSLLREVAALYVKLIKSKDLLSFRTLDYQKCERFIGGWYAELRNIVSHILKTDPAGAYVELKRIHRRESIKLDKYADETASACVKGYLDILTRIIEMFEKTKFIATIKQYSAGHKPGDREVYQRIFRATIKPDFMFTKLMATYPPEGEELDNYELPDGSEVTIFELPDTVQYLYHITPPEFRLDEDQYEILDTARKVMAEHKPKRSDFVDPERIRQVFQNVGKDLIEELAGYKNIRLKDKEITMLTSILVRYTIGFGLIEVLMQDEKIQDVTINSPMGEIPMFIVHQDFGDCKTNVIPTEPESESWASKLRLISGRPLDEANPILDTELSLPGASVRVAVIASPLNPTGLAYAFRRHRDRPWTLPLFIKQKMLDPLSAGILSFLIDGSRTMLIAGTRSAGKTSLLSAVMVEVMRRGRMITIEDTLELPVSSLRKLGFNIQSMKVASAMSHGTAEVPADEGIRTTLRLGDSGLIIGEVRSTEAKALYESMRIGAQANIVAGTIHADSPYGVFDRVTNDLGVPKTSFKATDVIVVANPIRSPDGIHRWRRVTQITEVRKQWENDPMLEQGFVDLMRYSPKEDTLKPSDELINGDSEVLKAIAGNVKEWAGNWDAIWENILMRAKIKESIVKYSEKHKRPDLLEAEFVILANDEFHKISDRVAERTGSLDAKKIFFEWEEWLKRRLKKDRFKAQ
ncbi:type II/IV secretion system ATPase subunit [Candidatus Woesearchaeota archaeon]|nr:type II/IV secretion system ATPase subunit [Candidatus Woesearchaeota archaeon]